MPHDDRTPQQILGLLVGAALGLAACSSSRPAIHPPATNLSVREGSQRLDAAARKTASASVWAFFVSLAPEVRTSTLARAKPFAMLAEPTHPSIPGEDRSPLLWGAREKEEKRPWWLDLVRAETAGLVRARFESWRDYEAGSVVEAYARALLEGKNAATDFAPRFKAPADGYASAKELADFLAAVGRSWGDADRESLGAAETARIALLLRGHPTFARRLVKMAEAEAHDVDLGFRNLLAKEAN